MARRLRAGALRRPICSSDRIVRALGCRRKGTRRRLYEKIPWISRTVRTLSTDECGRVVADLAEKPRHELLHLLMLRVYGWAFRLTPGLVLWLLRVTGAKRR